MNKLPLIFVVFLTLSQINSLKGQDVKPGERGEIRDAEFIIRKDRVLSLPKQPRVFERTPALPETQSQGKYTYRVNDFFLDLEPIGTDAQPFLRNFPAKGKDLYHNYAKLGFGNYISPLGEIHINSLENDYRNYGFFLKHHGAYEGPVDGSNSGEDHTQIRLDGSIFNENTEFFGDIGYQRDRHHFYGYSPESGSEINSDDIKQVFNNVNARVGLRKIERTELFNYEAAISLRLFNDNYLAREHEAAIRSNLGIRANDNLGGKMISEIFFTSPSDVKYSNINRNYFKFNPFMEYLNSGFKLRAGINVVYENDVVPNKKSDFHIFPNLNASYYFSELFGIYAGYDGDVIRNTYFSFAMENPFLGPSEQLRNTIQDHRISAGIQGLLNEEIQYKLGVNYSQLANMHFFGNSASDSTKFEVVYDNSTTVLNYMASIEWNYENWYKLQGSANYFQYNLSEIEGAWHRPEWEIKLNNYFSIEDKWMITANANLMGGIAVINFASDSREILSPIIDLGTKVDYAFSSRLSVFLEGNNLLNQNNQRFWNYRVRGIQGLAGVSFKF